MYARLGFSVAVAVEPDVLLVDEVLAVGDEQFQRRCTEKMAEIRASGRTVVFVSHGLAQVQQLCDSAVWIDKGEVRALGDTSDVVQSYLESVTTAYRLDDQGRQRTGSGEVALEVELIGASDDGGYATGSPVAVRMHWSTDQPMSNLVFGFSIRAADGYEISGVTTTDAPPADRYRARIRILRLLDRSSSTAARVVSHLGSHHGSHLGPRFRSQPKHRRVRCFAGTGDPPASGCITLRGRWG